MTCRIKKIIFIAMLTYHYSLFAGPSIQVLDAVKYSTLIQQPSGIDQLRSLGEVRIFGEYSGWETMRAIDSRVIEGKLKGANGKDIYLIENECLWPFCSGSGFSNFKPGDIVHAKCKINVKQPNKLYGCTDIYRER